MKPVPSKLEMFLNRRKTRVVKQTGFTVIKKENPFEIVIVEQQKGSARKMIETLKRKHNISHITTWSKRRSSSQTYYLHLTNEEVIQRQQFVSVHIRKEFQIFSKIENIEKVTL